MINSNEVRPGNWVLKITGMDTKTHPFFEYKSVLVDEYFYSFVKVCFPIPLTPAVLGNCGFKHEFGDWYKNIPEEGVDDGMPFLRLKHEDKNWYFKNNLLPGQPVYLHQLQNLVYALTHQELDVQLGFFENAAIIGPIDFFIKPLKKSVPGNQLL